MSRTKELGPQGSKVCVWCPFKGDPDYYVALPKCDAEGLTHCNKLYGSESGLTPMKFDQDEGWIPAEPTNDPTNG